MKWNAATKAFFAEELAKVVKTYVERTITPLEQRVSALEGENAMLHAKVAELEEQRPTLRRIA